MQSIFEESKTFGVINELKFKPAGKHKLVRNDTMGQKQETNTPDSDVHPEKDPNWDRTGGPGEEFMCPLS